MHTTANATIPMESLLAMLSGMSLNDRRWLAEQLAEQVEREASETAKSWNEFLSKSKLWRDDSDERLDDALARFHKDWGGEKDPMEIAQELRQGAEMVNDVETW